MTKPFPWGHAMQFGFGVLHLSPEAFWRMTPRELAQAITAVRGHAAVPMSRENLDALMRRFPDHITPSCAGLTRASIHLRKTLSKRMDCRVKPGNDERK